MKKAPNNVKAVRESLGVRPELVAGEADISLVHYRRLEEGLAQPGLAVARRVAAALRTTIDALWPEVSS